MLHPHRRLLFALFFFPLFISCEKLIEDKKKDLLMEIITNGTWYIHQYREVDTDITEEFSGYQFQFFENGVVTGEKEAAATDGVWEGDVENISIHANFPSAAPPLSKLSGIWKIKDSGRDFVKAEMTVSTGKNLLHLLKNK
ncbi:MAG TPA: hypothetical protein PK339_11980 [Flavitalea sp.]|nr:hypothetical protein [Flavitalea sp.]